MKYIFLLFIIPFTFSKIEAQEQGKIVVKGAFQDTLVICNITPKVNPGQRYFKYEFNGKESKSREYAFQNELDGSRLFFFCNHNFTYIELKAGESIEIEISKKGFRFSGANKLKNEYLYNFCQSAYCSYPSALNSKIVRTNVLAHPALLSGAELFQEDKLKGLTSLEDECLKQLDKSKITDENFIQQQKLLIKYLKEEMLLSDYSYAKALKYDIPESFFKLIESITFEDADLLDLPRKWAILSDYSRYLKDERKVQFNMVNYIASFASEIKDQTVKESYIFYELNELIQRKNTFKLLEIIDACAPLIKTETGQKSYTECRRMAEQMLSRMPLDGEKVFPFAYKNQEGKVVKLSDFKGKYVFIDIWATWCGPCKAQMPYLKQLEEEMEGRNIEFVSISVDSPRDRQKWLDYVKKNDMAGHTLMADNALKDEMMVKYGVKAIPRFMLIDPQGNIVSSNTPKPSDLSFREYLKKIIK